MSPITRSRARDVATLLVVGLLTASTTRAMPTALALPPAAAELVPGARALGGGELRFFGLAIYDGFYWAATRDYSPGAPFALDLHYHRELDGKGIARRSVDEIARLGFGTPMDRRRWGEAMERLFPDVRRGERMTGVNVPGQGVRFFHNGAPIGRIDDVGFAHAFFAIWLDPRTSRPDFRRLLTGQQ